MGGGSWFQKLFGFREGAYDETQKKLQLNEDRTALRGPNGIDYQIGRFRTPSLAELEALLEEQGGMGALPGRLVVKNIVGEISAVIGDAANGKSTIQVASQFNCLEFPSPSALPEDGVTGYVGDRTQGPACSIACGPATVYRNYFAEVGGEIGQRSHRQINNLADICALLDNGDRPPGRYFDVENGYTMSDDARLGALNARLPEEDLEALKRALRVGVHDDVQVSSRNWGTEQLADQGRLVSQVFGSACSVSYSRGSKKSWEPFAKLVLEASYEATLYAGLLTALRHGGEDGSRRVFLTALGGGVFGNSVLWIEHAMRKAFEKFQNTGLEVYIVNYSASGAEFRSFDTEFSG